MLFFVQTNLHKMQSEKKNFFEVKTDESGDYQSLFTNRAIPAMEIVSEFSYEEIFTQPNRYTVQIDKEKHISLKPVYLRYLNHSCAPNVFFDTQKMELITLRHIKAGEELTFFYPSTEWQMEEVFDCGCGTANCLGEIRGAGKLSVDELSNYRLNHHIVEQYKTVEINNYSI